ncbi:Fimbrillin-like [Prevotellaceae bacterium HUN156]|nr:Fimbrillin-like [Prevotellaceae bacterium HUN156]
MRKRKIYDRGVGAAMVALALLCLSFGSCASEDVQKSSTDNLGRQPQAFYINTIDTDADGTTRGFPSEDLEEPAGIYAYTYVESDAWDDSNGTPPDFMINEEIQFAGLKWLTVNTFDKMPSERFVRYYAYYPYGLDPEVLELSDENHDNAPLLVYTVPDDVEEQVDLLAGGCVNEEDGHTIVYSTDKQNSKDPDKVTVTLSHLLTAIRFQVGECVEAGRVKKITVTNVLGKNQYSLQRDAEDNYYEGWEVRNWGENWDDDFRDFSIELNTQIKLTQKNAGGDVIPQAVTDKTQWLMMIPQMLSEESEIQVIYNSGGTDHVLTAEVYNYEWAQGKMVTYTLNIKSLQRLTVKSTVIPWGEGLRFQDGQPTNATTLDMGADFVEWDPTDTDIASDDPRD